MRFARFWAVRETGSYTAIWIDGTSTAVISPVPRNLLSWYLGTSWFWSDISLETNFCNTSPSDLSGLFETSSVKYNDFYVIRILDRSSAMLYHFLACVDRFFIDYKLLHTWEKEKRAELVSNTGRALAFSCLINLSITTIVSCILIWLSGSSSQNLANSLSFKTECIKPWTPSPVLKVGKGAWDVTLLPAENPFLGEGK